MLADPGLYVHFPWCVKKCPYCDFNSHPVTGELDQSGYVRALVADLKAQTSGNAAIAYASVFFGGGTPSLFEPEGVAAVLDQVTLNQAAEVTLEANPGTQEYADFRAFHDAGVNRISLGAQTFDDDLLRAIGRIHQSDETHAAFEKVRAASFSNVNIDLMWGLPGQSCDAALRDLEHAIDLGPEHISWYQLTIEPKTEFARRTPILPVEAVLADIEQAGLERLRAAGYGRYEVSAFAQPGMACKHNVNYWQFGDYIGIGAGAHGKVSDGVITRTEKARQPRLYLQEPEQTQRHAVASAEIALEFLMNALRLIDGVEWEIFTERTGLDRDVLEPAWENLIDQGLVRRDRCATTPQGLRYLDSVLGRFT